MMSCFFLQTMIILVHGLSISVLLLTIYFVFKYIKIVMTVCLLEYTFEHFFDLERRKKMKSLLGLC